MEPHPERIQAVIDSVNYTIRLLETGKFQDYDPDGSKLRNLKHHVKLLEKKKERQAAKLK